MESIGHFEFGPSLLNFDLSFDKELDKITNYFFDKKDISNIFLSQWCNIYSYYLNLKKKFPDNFYFFNHKNLNSKEHISKLILSLKLQNLNVMPSNLYKPKKYDQDNIELNLSIFEKSKIIFERLKNK